MYLHLFVVVFLYFLEITRSDSINLNIPGNDPKPPAKMMARPSIVFPPLINSFPASDVNMFDPLICFVGDDYGDVEDRNDELCLIILVNVFRMKRVLMSNFYLCNDLSSF